MNPSGPLNRPDPRLGAAISSRQMTEDSNRENVISAQATRDPAGAGTVLLDMSGDKKASLEWAVRRWGQPDVKTINKADLKWTSKLAALAVVRALKPKTFLLFTGDLNLQSGLGALMLFGVFAGARHVVIGDRLGRNISRSRLSVLILQTPRFVLELLAGYLFLIPLSWLLTEILRISLIFRAPVRASRIRNKSISADQTRSLRALYIRATMAIAAEGGMPTHVAGFASGATALGHQLRFLTSDAQRSEGGSSIAPSLMFSATRALFELWNNLVFTSKALRLISGDSQSSGIDFIYQRYSRFNWTGVALSLVTGIPLALEYNGSEVWAGRQWDPIGQLWLLRRFERLNQRAADLVFVVSDVERRNLRKSGVTLAGIIVNPNGVDPERFQPGYGGREIRRALGVDDKTVVGFVGTFGPWHGAPVLAEAARVLAAKPGIHFLFIGDGDQRGQTESIVESSQVSATFAGRISHDKVASYLDACDILVSPHVPSADGSEFFGSPTKLFEYMAMGKGVVASRLGQIAEVITDGENGLLVEPGDAIELARAIEKLAGDSELRAQLGAAARGTAIKRYTWRHNAERVFDAMSR